MGDALLIPYSLYCPGRILLLHSFELDGVGFLALGAWWRVPLHLCQTFTRLQIILVCSFAVELVPHDIRSELVEIANFLCLFLEVILSVLDGQRI